MRDHDWKPERWTRRAEGWEIVTECARCRARIEKWLSTSGGIDSEQRYFDGAHIDDLSEDPGCDPDARVCACGFAVIHKSEDCCIRCADAFNNEADVA